MVNELFPIDQGDPEGKPGDSHDPEGGGSKEENQRTGTSIGLLIILLTHSGLIGKQRLNWRLKISTVGQIM